MMTSEMNLGGGTPQNFWSFMSPTRYVLLHFKKEFSKIFKIWSFMYGHFFRKIPQNFQKFPEIFSTFSKLKKTIVFVTKLVQNDYIDQN